MLKFSGYPYLIRGQPWRKVPLPGEEERLAGGPGRGPRSGCRYFARDLGRAATDFRTGPRRARAQHQAAA